MKPYKEESIEVDVPVRTAYNQWTQFEEFPKFMDAVQEVVQLDDKHLLWNVKIAGRELQWHSEISDQTPDERIAWRSTNGPDHGGAVLFEPLGPDRTRVTVRLQYEPQGLAENVASALGIVSGRVEDDLENFKKFIESRGVESGAWRGEIHGEKVLR
jgi:uncharacterized membrane protein